MKYKINSTIKKHADKVVKQMDRISGGDFDFKYKITDDGIEFISDDYFIYQSQGVKGTEDGKSREGFKYTHKMPPPSAFSKYASDRGGQFAIAKSIQQKGIKAKNYAEKFNTDKIINDNLEKIYEEFVYQKLYNE